MTLDAVAVPTAHPAGFDPLEAVTVSVPPTFNEQHRCGLRRPTVRRRTTIEGVAR